MIKDFKFLSKISTINYHGEMSIEAIQFYHEHIVGRWGPNCEITTRIATYKIVHQYCNGRMESCIMKVYPLNSPSTTITFWINAGNAYPYITEHQLEMR